LGEYTRGNAVSAHAILGKFVRLQRKRDGKKCLALYRGELEGGGKGVHRENTTEKTTKRGGWHWDTEKGCALYNRILKKRERTTEERREKERYPIRGGKKKKKVPPNGKK